jgi:MFS family permease
MRSSVSLSQSAGFAVDLPSTDLDAYTSCGVSVLTAASGIALVAFAADLLLGGIGVLLWGLGTSLGFPIALSAAGDHPTLAARRVGLVVAVGYAGVLIGPPLPGFLAEHAGLRTAILVVPVAVLTALFFSKSVQKAG